MLNQEQRSQLLRIARESIEAMLDGRRPHFDVATLDDDLKRPSGAFVTLNERSGELRGCIGSIEARAPLAQAVSSSAINAAFRDPRFYPVTREELPNLHIEISVMSPIVPVSSIDEIEVGCDGLIISRGSRAGLLLPQVATEYEWDRETFLSQTCVKAGLPPDCWQSPDCRIEKFSAEVFGE
ncbi:MAG TPA: AmmeMemoRadiSam system protein A [Thermoanaerobaculia bacterium]|nr:AmmeMemoRadiSam system protein A [Thermoanaerobaculia bacterium]